MHQVLSCLPFTQFLNFRLILPCIIHHINPIVRIRADTGTATHVHPIQARGLEPIENNPSKTYRTKSFHMSWSVHGTLNCLTRPWCSTTPPLTDGFGRWNNRSVHSYWRNYPRMSMSRPVLPDRELTKGGSAITSGCQQHARAMKLQYVAWWWRSRERKPTGFRNGFGRCLASVSMSRRESE